MNSCITDNIDENTNTRIDEEEGMICFKSSASEFNDRTTKSGKNVQILPCTPAQWGQISAEATQIDNRLTTTKGTPISSMTNISDAGVFCYVSSGNFDSGSSTGITPSFMYNKQLTQTNGVWSYSPKKYWPKGATSKTSFFAYSPYASGTNGITPSTNTIPLREHPISHTQCPPRQQTNLT